MSQPHYARHRAHVSRGFHAPIEIAEPSSQQIESMMQHLQTQLDQLDAREAEIAGQLKTLAQQEQQLHRLAEQTDARAAAIREELESRYEHAELREKSLAEQRQQLTAQQAELEELAQQLAQAEAELDEEKKN